MMTVSISLMSEADIFEQGYQLIVRDVNWDSYKYLFQYPERMLEAYKTTIIVTVCGTVVSVLMTALIAYPLSRMDFAYRRYINFFVFFTMLFSGGLVASYILTANWLNLKDTLWALILPSLAAPFHIFLMRIFFQGLPDSLVEAARIDGMSEFRIFATIVVPLCKQAFATIGLLTALGYWNEAFLPMLYIDDPKLTTLQLMLKNLVEYVNLIKTDALRTASGGSFSVIDLPSDGVMFATVVVASAPMLFIFAFFQKYFVKGIMTGAIKG